jgi:IS5 family transposase
LWRWLKRRAAIEPGIGHLKQEHRMDRNRLKGQAGDMLNAIFSAAGMNFRKLRAHAAAICALLRALLRLALHRLGQLHRPPTHAITPLFMPVA